MAAGGAESTTDIAIIGGGIVGLCAALALGRHARRITVLEAAALAAHGAGGLNTRSIALAHSSRQVFRALGLWERLDAAAIRRIHISARGHWGVTRLDAADYRLDQLGGVVEHDTLLRVLLDAVGACARIRLVQGAAFESFAGADRVGIEYRRAGEAGRLRARLVIVADGADSPAREALGIGCDRIDYGQAVVVCNIEVGGPRSGTAYERFTDDGPLALLPLGGRRYACVWTLAAAGAARIAALPDDAFIAELQRCFGYRLGIIERAGERVVAPVRRVSARALYRGRCLLLGNAANALHPVAGQGFNLALRDIASLDEMLAGSSLAEFDTAAAARLGRAYQSARRREQRRVIRYGDGLVALFSSRLPGLGGLRGAGLGLLDLLPALKAEVALAGMGMRYGGNRMLRGHR